MGLHKKGVSVCEHVCLCKVLWAHFLARQGSRSLNTFCLALSALWPWPHHPYATHGCFVCTVWKSGDGGGGNYFGPGWAGFRFNSWTKWETALWKCCIICYQWLKHLMEDLISGFKSSHSIATPSFSVRVVDSVSGALEKMTNQGPMYNWHMPAKWSHGIRRKNCPGPILWNSHQPKDSQQQTG